MIANFFQSLSRHQVEYLLISGQATVLYGAATFSEDIDLWITPAAENLDLFIAVLRECHARYYKLTPPFTVDNLRRGHGFHFVLAHATDEMFFLDVMGAPPRIGDINLALRSARWLKTEWGPVRTIGLQPLVELKKTQRLEDYPIISKLALAWFDQPECARIAGDFQWAIQNILTLPELRTLFETHPEASKVLSDEPTPSLKVFAQKIVSGEEIPDETADQVQSDMEERISELQRADRHYWRKVISELKQLRATAELMPEGAVV